MCTDYECKNRKKRLQFCIDNTSSQALSESKQFRDKFPSSSFNKKQHDNTFRISALTMLDPNMTAPSVSDSPAEKIAIQSCANHHAV